MPTMAFGRKRSQDAPQQQQQPQGSPSSSVWNSYSNGSYMATELPTYHKGKRRIVVYTSDASGKIIKTFKR